MSRSSWDGTKRRIHMNEVGTRDGLQVEQAFVEDATCNKNQSNAAVGKELSKVEANGFLVNECAQCDGEE